MTYIVGFRSPKSAFFCADSVVTRIGIAERRSDAGVTTFGESEFSDESTYRTEGLLKLVELDDIAVAASEQDVEISTIRAMQTLFNGELGAFSYLLFILLYMPCVATVGVIFKEIGAFWAVFSTSWSVIIAYAVAVLCYQLGSVMEAPLTSLMWAVGVTAGAMLAFLGLIRFGQQRQRRLIALVSID